MSRNIYPLSEMWVVETKWKCNTDSLKLDKLPQPRVVEEHFFYAPQEAKLHGKSLHIDAWRRLVLLHLKYACFMMLLNSVSNGQTTITLEMLCQWKLFSVCLSALMYRQSALRTKRIGLLGTCQLMDFPDLKDSFFQKNLFLFERR